MQRSERIAQERNYSLQSARFELESSVWEKRSLIATFFPSVAFSSNWFRAQTPDEDQLPGTAPPITPSFLTPEGFSHQLTISQPIFNSGTEYIGLSIAQNTLSSLEYSVMAAKQDAILNVRTNYLNALLSNEQVKIDSTGIEWVRRNLESARIRLEEGLLPVSEVLRLEAELFERQARYYESRALAETSLAELLLSMGETNLTDRGITLEGTELLERLYEDPDTIASGTLHENPSILAVSEQLRAAQRAVMLSYTPFLPRLNAFVQYSWPADEELIPQDEGFWALGVQLDITLFTAGQRYTRLRESRYQSLATETKIRELIGRTEVSLHRAEVLYRSSRLGVEASAKRLEIMQRALSMVEQRYQAGLSGLLDLLDTRLQMETARSVYYSAMAHSILKRSEYLRAVGLLEETR